jgi:preprotein translocase subunit Sss1
MSQDLEDFEIDNKILEFKDEFKKFNRMRYIGLAISLSAVGFPYYLLYKYIENPSLFIGISINVAIITAIITVLIYIIGYIIVILGNKNIRKIISKITNKEIRDITPNEFQRIKKRVKIALKKKNSP